MNDKQGSTHHATEHSGYPEKWYDAKPESLTEPTYWPIVLAAGTTLLAWGIVTSYLLSILGGGMSVVAVVNWIGDIRREQFENEE
jgi:hypothetical protein